VKNEVYKLAIESGIGSGSVSIIENKKILDYRSGSRKTGKADYLIEEISDLIKLNKIEKSKITSVIYSEFPGSHTGLKIGASIAGGLRIAFNAALSSKNLFDSIFKNIRSTSRANI
jgi:tRNA A37 threonylcarbamoyladenosine modification protein TsaB